MDTSYIYKSVHPVFLMLKILGLCTLKLNWRKGYATHFLGFLVSLFFLAVYTSCVVIYALHSQIFQDTKYWILHSVTTLNNFARIVTLLVTTTVMLFSGQKIAQILIKIMEIDTKMNELQIDLQKTSQKRCRYITLAVVCQVIHFVYYLTLNYLHAQQELASTLQNVCFIIATTGGTLNSGAVLFQFVVLTSLIKERFEYINQNFRKLHKHCKKNYASKSTEELLLKYLNWLGPVHKNIRDVAIMTQNVFALTNLLVLFKASVSLTTSTYSMLNIYFLDLEKKSLVGGLKHWSTIFTNVFYILSLTLICTRTTKESNQIVILVLKLSFKSEIVAIKIWNLILQIKNETVGFSCFGLFTINQTLLRTILGVVGTFSIIIIQFEAGIQNSIYAQNHTNESRI